MANDYQTFRVRWVLLGILCLGSFSRIYMSTSFEVCNNIVTEYFQITPYATDALAVVDFVVAFGVCLGIAFAGPWIGGVRYQSITLSSCLLVAAATSTFGFMSRNTYWIVAAGRVVSGLSTGLLYVLPSLLATAWFPANEIATAFSLPFSFLSIGALLSVPVFSTTVPQLMEVGEPGSGGVELDVEDGSGNVSAVRLSLMVNYGVIALLLFITTILLCVYARDKPPTPPSAAQANLLEMDKSKQRDTSLACAAIKSRVAVIKSLMSSRAFVCLTLANCFMGATLAFSAFLSNSMIRVGFPDIANVTATYILMVTSIGGAVGSIITGRVLDRFGSYKLVAIVGTLGQAAVAVLIYVGHYYKSVPVLYALYTLLMTFRTSTVSSYVQFLEEATYPSDRSIVMPLHFAFYNLGPFVFASLERILIVPGSERNAAFVPISASLISLALVALVKPTYMRSKVNEGEEKKEYEKLEGDNSTSAQAAE